MGAVEFRRVGALEGVDRLLAVAHREDGARPVAGALAGEEFLGQGVGDAPLLGRGVLHLIQQQVVQAAVQLVQHPGGARIEQQRAGAVDQVVVIEQSGLVLALRIAVGDRSGQQRQCARYRGEADRASGVLDSQDAGGFFLVAIQQVGPLVRQRLVDQRRVAAWFARCVQEMGAPISPILRAAVWLLAQPVQHRGRPIGDGLGAAGQHGSGRVPQGGFAQPLDGIGDQGFLVRSRHAEDATLRPFQFLAELQGVSQSLAIPLQGLDVTAERFRRTQPGQCPQRVLHRRGAGVGQHVLPRFGQGIVGVAVIDQLEMRGDRGFQREAPQQRLAERVDRADAHAAGQVEHLGEQRARGLAGGFGGFHVQARQFLGQFAGLHRHPPAERSLQSQRHFGGGGLGEGQALDPFRGGAGQHQAQQPVGEKLGLSGSGRGGHEGGYRGVGGRQLFPVGSLAGGFGGRVSHSSPPGVMGEKGLQGCQAAMPWVMGPGRSIVGVFNTEAERGPQRATEKASMTAARARRRP